VGGKASGTDLQRADVDLDEAAAARVLTVREAAAWAGVTRAIINGWIQSGQLPATLVEHRRHVRLADLAAVQATEHLGGVVPAWRQDRRRAGHRLRTLREAAGLSQLALAAASGLTHEEISQLELGQRAPAAETVRRLAEALGVATERFTDRDPVGLTTLTVAEAAARLGVPVRRVRQWLQRGELAGTKVSGEWRVLAVVVAEFGRSGRLRGRSRRLDPRYRG
jgi:excisionase family DNA binding protein